MAFLDIGERNGNPLQYSCLKNPMDTGAWRATIHGVARVVHDLETKPPQFLCHMINSCELHNSVVFSTFTELHNHDYNLFFFHHSIEILFPVKPQPLYPNPAQPLATTNLLSVSINLSLLGISSFPFLFYFVAAPSACGISVPWPRTEPGPSTVTVRSPSLWIPRELPGHFI